MRTRESNIAERSTSETQDGDDQAFIKEHQKNQKQKLDELQAKNEHYQKIKNKYFDGQDEDLPPFEAQATQRKKENDSNDVLTGTSKLQISSKAFDPDFIRDDPPRYGQGSWGNSNVHKQYY